jgi:hypothetical protein
MFKVLGWFSGLALAVALLLQGPVGNAAAFLIGFGFSAMGLMVGAIADRAGGAA